MRNLAAALFFLVCFVHSSSAGASADSPPKPHFADEHLPHGNATVLSVASTKTHLHVFALGKDGNLWTKYQDLRSHNWTAYIQLAPPPTAVGGNWEADPVAFANPSGVVEVFIRSSVNLDLWQFYLTDAADPTSWAAPREPACLTPGVKCYNTQPVFPTSDVTLHRLANGVMQLMYRGFDGMLYSIQQKKAGKPHAYTPPYGYNVLLE